MIGFIYKVVAPNSKIYIGQTIDLYGRKRKYAKGHFKGQLKLWNSCQKYEWNPLDTFEIIEQIELEEKSLLNEREIFWIQFYNSFEIGLNCDKGGKGRIGYKPSEETKAKLRAANLGKKHTEEAKRKISEASTGRKHSLEAKEKIRNKKKGSKLSDEQKKLISENNKGNKKRLGKFHSEDTKNKISAAKKGVKLGTGKKVICATTGEVFDSIREAEDHYKISKGKVSMVCSGQRKSCNGLKFEYYE